MEPQGGIHEEARIDSALAARLRRVHLFAAIAGIVWVVGSVVLTAQLSDKNMSRQMADAAKAAEADTKAVAGVVNRMFHELTAIPQVLSTTRELRTLVHRYNTLEAGFAALSDSERNTRLRNDPAVSRLGARLSAVQNKLDY